ncbi:MAG: hypothetical protein PUE33_07470 [bacterium]|nr:hypothetical protein [bacterium]
MQALHDYNMEKIVDMQEYKYINRKKRTYTYDEVIDLAYSIASRKEEQKKKARKERFWNSATIVIPMVLCGLIQFVALLLGF